MTTLSTLTPGSSTAATALLVVVLGAQTACVNDATIGSIEASAVGGASPELPGGDEVSAGAIREIRPGGGSYDIVVYGATPAGIMAAVAAARQGARVALLEPGRHVGGMMSSGLGWTDFGNKSVIGGMSLGFFQRAGKKYNTTIAWTFEPHVAETIFQELLAAEVNIDVGFGERLRERTGVDKTGTRLTAMHMESRRTPSSFGSPRKRNTQGHRETTQ